MPILKTSYETSTLKNLDKELIKPLTLAINSGELKTTPRDSNLVVITHDLGIVGDIPAFHHPVEVTTVQNTYYALDARFFMGYNRSDELKVRQPSDLMLNLFRLSLTSAWNREGPTYLLNVSPVSLNAYSQWVTRSLSAKLNPDEFYQCKAIVALYYFSQFVEGTEFTESEKLSALKLISRFIKIPADQISEMIESVGVIGDLTRLCDVIRSRIPTTRLKSLNKGLLINLLINGWFGIASKEILASAIEFAPDFLSLMFMALTSRPHHNTHLAKAVNAAVHQRDATTTARAIATAADYDHLYSELMAHQ